jgi:hypothetical protein
MPKETNNETIDRTSTETFDKNGTEVADETSTETMGDKLSTEIGFAVAGALVTLVVVSAIAMLVGYSLPETVEEANLSRNIHYLLAVGMLGAGLATAWRQYARIAAVGGALALLGWVATHAPGIPKPLTTLNIGLTVLAVVFIQAASIEYALRNPTKIRRIFTPRAVKVGTVVGVYHALIVFALHAWLGFSIAFLYTLGNAAIGLWTFGGAFVVGAGVGVTLTRYRLVTPVLVVAGLLSWVTYASSEVAPALRDGNTAIGGTVFYYYEWGWYVVLLVALIVGLLEYVLRPWAMRNIVKPSRTSD